jgi:hypothetical protein
LIFELPIIAFIHVFNTFFCASWFTFLVLHLFIHPPWKWWE